MKKNVVVPREARLINQSGRRPERNKSRANSSEKYIYIHITGVEILLGESAQCFGAELNIMSQRGSVRFLLL